MKVLYSCHANCWFPNSFNGTSVVSDSSSTISDSYLTVPDSHYTVPDSSFSQGIPTVGEGRGRELEGYRLDKLRSKP